MKEEILTSNAPQPIGPYSQAIRANGFLFLSGQIPLIPGSEELLEGSIEDQTRRALENIKGVLEEAGTSFEKVVKCTVYLSDMNDFAAMNGVYGEYFTGIAPARAAVQAAGLPKGVDVEIDVIALA